MSSQTIRRPDPLAVYLLVICVLAGVVAVVTGTAPSQILQEEIPYPVVACWGVILSLGAGSVLLGLYWRTVGAGLLLIRTGAGAVSLAALAFGSVCWLVETRPASVASLVLYGLSAVFGVLWWRTNQQVKNLIRDAR